MKTEHKSALAALVLGASAVIAFNRPMVAQSDAGDVATPAQPAAKDVTKPATKSSSQPTRIAQRGPGFGGPVGPRGGRRPGGPSVEQMTQELGLTTAQQTKIKAILDARDAKIEQLRNNDTLAEDAKHDAMRDAHESTRTQIDAVLTEAQIQKREESRGERGFGGPGGPGMRGPGMGGPGGPPLERMAEDLDLTPEQQTKVQAIFEEQRTQMEKIRETTRQKMDAVLTAEQRQKMSELNDHRGGPGFGGPGGPRGWDGPPPLHD